MTKSVCTGTRALVRTLPSGRISEETWEGVVGHVTRRSGSADLRPVRACGVREHLAVCRRMVQLVGGKQRKVRRSKRLNIREEIRWNEKKIH